MTRRCSISSDVKAFQEAGSGAASSCYRITRHAAAKRSSDHAAFAGLVDGSFCAFILVMG